MPRRLQLRRSQIALAAVTAACALAAAAPAGAMTPDPEDEYAGVIANVEGMVADQRLQALADRHGLDVLDLTWEDTGRFEDSSVGPNISDMTIQVQQCRRTDECSLHLMPVVRFPNFEDQTGDVPIDRLQVMVGNERGETPHAVPLREVLGDLRSYLHDPGSWAGDETSLLADRDTHALVSAQAAFLPIPVGGEAEFNPVIFNYQSYPGDPAVLTLLATPEGTSATVIDNVRDGFAAGQTWGQRLFFDQDGQRASLTGTRLSELDATGADPDGGTPRTPGEATDGLNMVMLIQVPLKQKERQPVQDSEEVVMADAAAPTAAGAGGSDVEAAVIGHGELEGPYTEIDGLPIERDDRFPIRVTVQFYKATGTGRATAADMAEIASQLDRVYDDADYVGSLVVDGPQGRPTEHDGPKVETAQWWDDLAQRLEHGLGWSVQDVVDIWQRLGRL